MTKILCLLGVALAKTGGFFNTKKPPTTLRLWAEIEVLDCFPNPYPRK